MADNKVSYRDKPRGVSVTVYDLQGSPISPSLIRKITSFVEGAVKDSGVKSLAIDVSEG